MSQNIGSLDDGTPIIQTILGTQASDVLVDEATTFIVQSDVRPPQLGLALGRADGDVGHAGRAHTVQRPHNGGPSAGRRAEGVCT